MILKIREPNNAELDSIKPNSTLVSFIQPAQNTDLVNKLNEKNITAFALDQVPRVTIAQACDVLSSQANIVGKRAVTEAANIYANTFDGGITAAGKTKPANVLVVGGGVSGLAAAGTAKNNGGNVVGFDVRDAALEQFESMRCKTIRVKVKEDGEGGGGYAKEMGPEFQAAQEELFRNELPKMDIVITTALIPGRPAPKLILKDMVASMKPGSVIVDLAAERGGNTEGCKPGRLHITENGVKIIGYTDLASRLPGQSSTMISNNITNFLKQISPSEEVFDYNLLSDLSTDNYGKVEHIVRGSIVTHQGQTMFPPPRCDPPPAPVVQAEIVDENAPIVEARERTRKRATVLGGGLVGGLGVLSANPAVPWLTLGLSTTVGAGLVRGVLPALHSPLMAVTNAISGLTAVGGLISLNGVFAASAAGGANALAITATGLSAVNIGGGFIVAHRMLDLFKRPQDPPEFSSYYIAPSVLTAGSVLAAHSYGMDVAIPSQVVAIGLCGGSLMLLSSQETARLGNILAMNGVGLGVLGTLCHMNPSLLSVGLPTLAAGALAGAHFGRKVDLQELPQTVALFHSFVGIAATTTCLSHYMAHVPTDAMGLSTGFIGAWVGGVTATGSIVAYKKLAGKMNTQAKAPMGGMALDGGMLALSAGSLGYIMANDVTMNQGLGLMMIPTLTSLWSGWRRANAVGGADMPVIITTLNSSSGWALAAEGIMMGNNLLTGVGCFIGSSGAFLSLVMCNAMNRSLGAVLFGSFGGSTGDAKTYDGVATETTVDETLEQIDNAESVIIVPGYGLCAANAQYSIAELAANLKQKGMLHIGPYNIAFDYR